MSHGFCFVFYFSGIGLIVGIWVLVFFLGALGSHISRLREKAE